jgi:FkbM family methyltransferase
MRERQRDINLRVLVGSKDGPTTFYSVGLGNGLSTTRKDFADIYKEKGLIVEEFEEACVTLDSVWAQHVKGPVHFLKIDVEGAEKDVLEGCNFLLHRPWVVVIEATLPNTSTPTHDDWQAILDAADYRFVVFDGLNRFYVAQEHFAQLSPTLREPIRPEHGFVLWNGQ